jgi:molybdate/tungstate transport system substrate-binding protein
MRRSSFTVSLAASAALLAPRAARADGPTVSVLYAGSLVTLMERTIFPAFAKAQPYTVNGEAKGSVALANFIRDGVRHPDVFLSADPKVIDPLLGTGPAHAGWYTTFATTRLLIGYSKKSAQAARFADVAAGKGSLADVLRTPGLRLGRTDPKLDPKGYRTIIAMKLLGRASHLPDLSAQVLGADDNAAQILPEETLLARLEAGDLDCGILYSTEVGARDIGVVEFPPDANLGDPSRAAVYATESVTVAGVVRTGAPVAYAITILNDAPQAAGAVAFVRFLLTNPALPKAGMTLVRPTITGNAASVPESLRALLHA